MSKKDPQVGDQLRWHYAGPSDLKIVYVDDAIVVWRAEKTIDKVGGFPFGGGYGCATRYDYGRSGPAFVRRASKPRLVGVTYVCRKSGLSDRLVRNDILKGLLHPCGTYRAKNGQVAIAFTKREADRYVDFKKPRIYNGAGRVARLAEEFGIEEAAKQLKISPLSVKRAIQRARTK